MSKTNLIHARTCVYNVNYHIVWSVKYRRKVLNSTIEQIKEIRYYQELVRRECNEILMYGFVFDDSKVKIKESTIKNL